MNAHDVIESGVRAWEDRGGPLTPRILEAIEASGFALVERRTVTTVDELIALPCDAIVREIGRAEWVWEKYGIDRTGKGEDEWYRMGWDGTFDPDAITLPVLVIFEGVQS